MASTTSSQRTPVLCRDRLNITKRLHNKVLSLLHFWSVPTLYWGVTDPTGSVRIDCSMNRSSRNGMAGRDDMQSRNERAKEIIQHWETLTRKWHAIAFPTFAYKSADCKYMIRKVIFKKETPESFQNWMTNNLGKIMKMRISSNTYYTIKKTEKKREK